MAALLIVMLTLTDLVSFALNSVVLYTFSFMRNSLTFKDYMMIGMAVGDLLQCILGYPLEIYSSNHGRWIFDIFFCKAAGFFVTFLGLVSTIYLTLLSCDLYISICRPFLATNLHDSFKVAFWTNFFPWAFSLFWAAAPLAGWSSYALEDDGLRCSINWNGNSVLDKTYIAFLFVFCYLIPLIILCTCFTAVRYELQRMRERAMELTSNVSAVALENLAAEKRHTKLALVMTTSFFIIWTPYTIISFLSAYCKGIVTVPIQLGTIAAVFAKMSAFFNPIIYSFLYARFRRNMAIPCIGKVFRQNAVHAGSANGNADKSVRSTVETSGVAIMESQI